MDWQEDYKRKMVTTEEAINVIKSGDRVAFVQGMEPLALGLALAARKEELRDVTIVARTPGRDFGWYDPGWEESFKIEIAFPLPIVRQMLAEKRCDLGIASLDFSYHKEEKTQVDAVLIELSPPDEHGFCSFGTSLWNKKAEVLMLRFFY